MIISSFFTLNGAPALGLSPLPTINIWSSTGTSEIVVIVGASMNEVGDGFYQYLFTGYNPALNYVFLVDGGSSTYSSDTAERYQAGSIQQVATTAPIIINSFFTLDGAPATGLNPLPTVDIFSETGTSSASVIVGASMNEVGDGFYQYLFTGYNPTVSYVFRADGGSTYASDIAERYQTGSLPQAAPTTPIFSVDQTVWVINPGNASCQTPWWSMLPTQVPIPAVQEGTVLQVTVLYTNNTPSPTITYAVRLGSQPGVVNVDQSVVFGDLPTAIAAYQAELST